MGKGLIFSLLCLGVSSVIGQVVVLRELTVSFYGNEFFIGVVLASWLAWVAVGSRLLGRVLNRLKNTLPALLALHFLVSAFLFLEILVARYLKAGIGFAGEMPNLLFSFGAALIVPLPLCVVLGLWWAAATKIALQNRSVGDTLQQTEASVINRAYFIETLGFILGGVLFSFVLVHLNEFLVVITLVLLNLTAIIVLLSCQKGCLVLKTLCLALFFGFIVLSYCAVQLEEFNNLTNGLRFKNQTLVASENSPYGSVAVTRINEQYNFYESGLLLGSTQDTEFAEHLIHLSLLQHPKPKKVLLIGGGFTGQITEILKHHPEKVYHVELDSTLTHLAWKYLPEKLKNGLMDEKVEFFKADGRYFLNQTQEKFDVVILNLPDPSTALLNRFYTKEFFAKAQQKLSENGVFALYLSFSETTASQNLTRLNASVFKTLNQVFKQVVVLSGQTNLFLASKQNGLTSNPSILDERLRQRNIQAKLVSPEYISYQTQNDRAEKIDALLAEEQGVPVNKDTEPIAYFYHTLFWLERFYPTLSNVFRTFANNFWWLFAVAAATAYVILSPLLGRKQGAKNLIKKRFSKALPLVSVSCAGFSLMALNVLIIFSYQTAVGYLYFRLALLISALMAGMALGVWWGNKKLTRTPLPRTSPIFTLRKLHLFLILFCLALALLLPLLLKLSSLLLAEVVFPILALMSGFLGALIFPFANSAYLATQPTLPTLHKKTSTIYAADLLGSCFGALLSSVILVPVFGLVGSLIFIIAANLLALSLIRVKVR